jgi:hypothetical protein
MTPCVRFLARTITLPKQCAAGIELQRQSSVPPAIAERLASAQFFSSTNSAIRKFQRTAVRRNLVFVDLPKDRYLMLDYFIAPSYQVRR